MGRDRAHAIKKGIRIALSITLGVAVFFWPWWVVCLIALALVCIARPYEIIAAGIAMDVLYGAPLSLFATIPLIYTITFTTLFFIADAVKARLFL